MFVLFILLIGPTYASLNTFEDFFKAMSKKNNEYLGSYLAQEAARERNEGTAGLYMPSLVANIEQFKQDDTSPANTDFRTRTKEIGFLGNIPQLGVNYSSTFFRDVEEVTSDSINHSGNFSFRVSVSLIKNIGFLTGQIPFKQAEINYDISKIARIKTVYTLFQSLLEYYSSAYASQKNLEITKMSQEINNEELRKSLELYKQGKIPKLSLLSLQTQSQQITLQMIEQERVVRDSIKNLYALSSVDQTIGSNTITYKLRPVSDQMFTKNIVDSLVNKKLNFKSLRNPEYLITKRELEQSRLSVVLSRNNVLPQLDLYASTTGSQGLAANPSLFPNRVQGNAIGLTFSIPLGLVTERHELAAARNELRIKELNLIQLQKNLKQEWENLKQQYQLISKQYELLQEIVKTTRERYKTSLPTAAMGPTYQQNVIVFQNEWINSQLYLNQVTATLLTTQLKILTFHAHPHIFEVIDRLQR